MSKFRKLQWSKWRPNGVCSYKSYKMAYICCGNSKKYTIGELCRDKRLGTLTFKSIHNTALQCGKLTVGINKMPEIIKYIDIQFNHYCCVIKSEYDRLSEFKIWE